MDIWVVLPAVIVLALLLATAAGFVAARVLMHAAQSRPPHGGAFDDR